MSKDKNPMDDLARGAASFDWISPVIQNARGLTHGIATGSLAVQGEKILKKARIPCAFFLSPDGSDCRLSVKREDVARAKELLGIK